MNKLLPPLPIPNKQDATTSLNTNEKVATTPLNTNEQAATTAPNTK